MVMWSPSGEKKTLWGSVPFSLMFLTEAAAHGKQTLLLGNLLKHVIAYPVVSTSCHPVQGGKVQTSTLC